MAATGTKSSSPANGRAPEMVDRAREAGGTVASVARRARTPIIAAGAATAGLAGGLALGGRRRGRRRGLRARPAVAGAAMALAKVGRELSSTRSEIAETSENVRHIRDQLDESSRRSPIEVLLEGLTHRRRVR